MKLVLTRIIPRMIIQLLKKKDKGTLNFTGGVFVLMVLTGFQNHAIAQISNPNGNVLKNWETLHTSNPNFQISYNVLACEEIKRLGLRLVNKTNISQKAIFRVDIYDNRKGDRISRNLDLTLLANQETQGDCQNLLNTNLMIDLPVDIDPDKIYVAVSF